MNASQNEHGTPAGEDETIGDVIDDANALMEQHIPVDALSRLDLSELSPELQQLIANEGSSVRDAEVQETILAQIAGNEGTRNAMLGVLRFMGKEDLAKKIEEACEAGTLTAETVVAIGETLGEGGGLTEVREQLTTLLSSVRSGGVPKGKASKEMRALIKEVSGNQTIRKEGGSVGRNDPCRCGSGKKFKKCCLGKKHK